MGALPAFILCGFCLVVGTVIFLTTGDPWFNTVVTWGPFLGPAYLGCSFFLWLKGRDPYRDNPFEREAFGDP